MANESKAPKAPLKWAGGKSRLSKEIDERIRRFKNKKRFVDLFSGSGTVTILASNHFSTILMNDLNSELINLYQVIKSSPKELVEALKVHQTRNSKSYFLEMRSLDQMVDFPLTDKVDLAARTIYLNKAGYNGLYRVNSKGHFNVPFGNSKFTIDEENIYLLSKLLKKKKITFSNKDFESLLNKLTKDDLVYIDPPYDRLENDTFNGYTKERFTREDQVRLKVFIDDLTKRGVGVIYSNHATDFIRTLFKKYINIDDQYSVQRVISAKSDNRKKVEELLISNERFI